MAFRIGSVVNTKCRGSGVVVAVGVDVVHVGKGLIGVRHTPNTPILYYADYELTILAF